MPYVPNTDRIILSRFLTPDFLHQVSTLSSGQLNYMITKMLLAQAPKSYADFNTLIGVLECCKLEMYRRAVAPYEDQKIEENGDVF